MKLFNKTQFKTALCATLIGVTSIACSAPPTPGNTASPAVTASSAPLIAMVTTDKSEGEGEAAETFAAVLLEMEVWSDKFDGTPLGEAGKKELIVVPDSGQLPGLWKGIQGMKTGGVRQIELSAKELFGEIPKGSTMKPEQPFYLGVSMKEGFPEEPFEIKTISEGKGEVVTKSGDRVRMHYTGRLTDEKGEVFDSSRDRGPFQVVLGRGAVIVGWDKGLLGMKEGEKRTLSIPHYLAYGNRAQGKIIKPKSRLFFEVEFVEFVRPGELVSKTTKEGKGEAIKAGEVGRFHYTGWLDGFNGKSKFDSSKNPGREPFPVKLGAGQVIKGWDEGLVGMKPGEVRQLTIPYNLAYGENGNGRIPAYSTLYFEVEYLGPGK